MKELFPELGNDEKDLKPLLQEFFRILNIKEVSDSGTEFSPTYISSCRVYNSRAMGEVLAKLEKLSIEQ